ncbi:hypothetical protein CKO15_10220 [Halorhodospira abdelmalekii]|uniref:hypothetical protein n=1 Tax=Halorhodospira abdelmalekii TaxID=421629 RepID=UPI001902D2CA|nr:hypothetical protein [Halorhodospira abdelmalekii]MBK1735651.1 hypothetical protein [Halorhodospira abdelmalekii]
MSALLDRSEIARLIPHQGEMVLLERVVEWDREGLSATASSHLDRCNPLCRDGALSGVHALEYAAQAMAVHGALLLQTAMPRPERMQGGVLAAGRGLSFYVARLDELTGELAIRVECEFVQEKSMIYRFRVADQNDATVADGQAIVVGR